MKKFIMVILCIPWLITAMDDGYSEGCEDFIKSSRLMSPEKVLEEAPCLSPIDLKKVAYWLESHKKLVNSLLTGPGFIKDEDGALKNNVKVLIDQNSRLLREHRIKNLSRWSYVLPISDSGMVIRIAGPENRYWNILRHGGFTPSNPPKPTDYINIQNKWEKWLKQGKSTYQTISNVPYYLRATRAKIACNLNKISFPETFLLQVPWKGKILSDDNYVVIQKKINADQIRHEKLVDGKRHEWVSDSFNKIDQKSYLQYLKAIMAIGLWDTKPNTEVDSAGNIVVMDLEQRNMEDPSQFFGKNKADIHEEIRNGFFGVAASKTPEWLGPSLLMLASKNPKTVAKAKKLHALAQQFLKDNQALLQHENVLGSGAYFKAVQDSVALALVQNAFAK